MSVAPMDHEEGDRGELPSTMQGPQPSLWPVRVIPAAGLSQASDGAEFSVSRPNLVSNPLSEAFPALTTRSLHGLLYAGNSSLYTCNWHLITNCHDFF